MVLPIFMDIKLRDGNCFEIFDKVKIESKIVFTTAFDEYALNAFNYNSIDYLLKPIDESKLNRLLEKIETLKLGFNNEISWSNFNESSFINSYLVVSGTHLKKIQIQDILYFFSENNATFIDKYTGCQSVIIRHSKIVIFHPVSQIHIF